MIYKVRGGLCYITVSQGRGKFLLELDFTVSCKAGLPNGAFRNINRRYAVNRVSESVGITSQLDRLSQ